MCRSKNAKRTNQFTLLLKNPISFSSLVSKKVIPNLSLSYILDAFFRHRQFNVRNTFE